jgi:putative ABC transport system permease protein
LLQRQNATVVFQEPRTARARHTLAQLPGVLIAEPFREVPVRLRFGHRSRMASILGITNEGVLRPLLDSEFRRVDLPEEGLVLNRALAKILGVRPGDVLQVEVLEGARPVRSVPVVSWVDEPVGLGVYMQADALHRLMREAGTVSGAYLATDSAEAARLYSFLKRTPSVSGVAVKDAMVASFWKSYGDTIWISTSMLVGFAAVIAFGIVYNNARIALSERGHELASLRVLGYTKAEISRILLGEQGILTALAIPFGFVMGYLLSVLTARAYERELFRLPLVITPRSYAYAGVVVVTAAVISGFVVIRRLSRMDLTEVLKSRE